MALEKYEEFTLDDLIEELDKLTLHTRASQHERGIEGLEDLCALWVRARDLKSQTENLIEEFYELEKEVTQ